MSVSPDETESPERAPGVSRQQKAAWVNDAMGFLGGVLLVLSLKPVVDLVDLPEGPAEGILYAGIYLTCVAAMVSLVAEFSEEGGSPKGR